jgi:CubicO group peptidase (beta-lactamase class C family)
MMRTDSAAAVLPRTRALVQRGIDDKLHLGAQIYVSLPDRIVADIAIGHSRPGTPLRPEDLMLWLSSGKPVTAVGIMQLVQRERLRLDDAVAVHLPEFAHGGKEGITIRHLLTHTAGIRPAAMRANGQPWEQVIAEICAARLERGWLPGQTAGYHHSSSWYILGELIQRASGMPYVEYMRGNIFLPLRMNDCWIGMPPDEYHARRDRIAPIYDTSTGSFEQEQFSNSEAGVVMPRPAGGARGPANQLGRFYEMLRSGGTLGAARVISTNILCDMMTRHRTGKHDKTFGHVIDWGLGFILNSRRESNTLVPYGYGPHASESTFGHSGAQSSCAFCDPEHGLVVAWLFNGMPGEPTHQRRQDSMNASIYEDLNLLA